MENNTALLNKEDEQQNLEDARNILALAVENETENIVNKKTIEYIREKGKVTYNENSPIHSP